MESREEFLARFYKDEASTVTELERLRGIIKDIETDTYFIFKTRLNKQRNKSLVVKSGGLYIKLDVLTDTTAGHTTQTLSVLDKEGYELQSVPTTTNEIKTAKQLALLIGIDEDDYDDSARIKAY